MAKVTWILSVHEQSVYLIYIRLFTHSKYISVYLDESTDNNWRDDKIDVVPNIFEWMVRADRYPAEIELQLKLKPITRASAIY